MFLVGVSWKSATGFVWRFLFRMMLFFFWLYRCKNPLLLYPEFEIIYRIFKGVYASKVYLYTNLISM